MNAYVIITGVIAAVILSVNLAAGNDVKVMKSKLINLPEPITGDTVSLEESLKARRSVRDFASDILDIKTISKLLWAAQGMTANDGRRTAPSAGALYPLEVYLVVGKIKGLDFGIFRYLPEGHRLAEISEGEHIDNLVDSVFSQRWIDDAAAIIVITSVYERVTRKYGERGIRYAHIEAGCAAQNVSLQATALGLGTTVVGAFDDSRISRILKLGKGESPLVILPIGRPAKAN